MVAILAETGPSTQAEECVGEEEAHEVHPNTEKSETKFLTFCGNEFQLD